MMHVTAAKPFLCCSTVKISTNWRAIIDDTILVLQEDWIGLQALDERGAIRLEECPGRHMEVTLKYFQQHVIQPYLKAT